MLFSITGPDKVPVFRTSWLKAGLVAGFDLVRVTVVVFTVVVFSATTRIWIVFDPTLKATGALTPELEEALPLTVTVAFASDVLIPKVAVLELNGTVCV
jgi:hypothetical protein